MKGQNLFLTKPRVIHRTMVLIALLLGSLAISSLTPITALADDNPIPARIPVSVRPLDFSFSACANGGENRTQERTFAITNTDTRPLKVTFIFLEPSVPDDWLGQGSRGGNQGLRGGTLQPGGALHFPVAFNPQAVRNSTAVLRFDVEYRLQGGTVQERVQISLSGVGRDCAPPPGGPGGQPGGDTNTGTDDGTGTGEGGNSDTTPPAQPDIEVCVTFHIVTARQPDPVPTNRDVDQWIESANRVFDGSGVKFKRTKPIDRVQQAGQEEDPHCLDVYLVDDIPGTTAGVTSVTIPRTRRWSGLVDGLGLPENVANLTGYGTGITMESGAGASQTLAHELGHGLGLGVSPDDTAARQEHLDPETGRPIAERGRLMHPEFNGTDLTDKEKEIAREVAEFQVGTFVRCENAFRIVPGSSNASLNPQGDLVYASIASLDDRLEFTVLTAAPLGILPTTTVYAVEMDTDLDGQADQRVSFQYFQGEWFGEPLLEVSDPPQIDPPGYLVSRAQGMSATVPGSVDGLILSIPRDALPTSFGQIGWRVVLQVPELDTRDVLPEEGFEVLNITIPDIMVDLEEDSRDLVAQAGQTAILEGVTLPSSTFTGDVEFSATLASADGSQRFPLGTLTQPVADNWSFELALPEDLEVGRYDLTVEAWCDLCRRMTSLNGQLQLEATPTPPTPTRTLTQDETPRSGLCNGRGRGVDLGVAALLVGIAAIGLVGHMKSRYPC